MNYKKILVPMDGSKESRSALQEAIYLAGLCQASLGLLNVVDLNKEISAFEQVSTGGYIPGELKNKGYELLADIMHEIPKEIKAKAIVEVGLPPKMIVKIAAENGYDLIIMGSRGLGMLENLIVGGVSQYVLHHAACPVLIAR